MRRGLAVHMSDEGFEAAGQKFPPGSLLLRRHENSSGWAERVQAAARAARSAVLPVESGRAPADGHDLGGGHFHLLRAPRVALLSGPPVSADGFGHLWQWLDEELRLEVSVLDLAAFGAIDLRRYNVLVVPPASGLGRLLEPHAEALRTWVRGGGTLIACGSAAAALTRESLALTKVVRLQDALAQADAYRREATREREREQQEPDWEQIWDPTGESVASPNGAPAEDAKEVAVAGAEQEGARRRYLRERCRNRSERGAGPATTRRLASPLRSGGRLPACSRRPRALAEQRLLQRVPGLRAGLGRAVGASPRSKYPSGWLPRIVCAWVGFYGPKRASDWPIQHGRRSSRSARGRSFCSLRRPLSVA